MTGTFEADTHTYRIDGKVVPSVTDILYPLTAKGLSMVPPVLLRQKASLGSLVHEYAADMDYCVFSGECEVEAAGYLQAYEAFRRDYRPDWHYIEHPLYCPLLGYAGTLDRAGFVDKEFTVCDFKTYASVSRSQKVALAAQLSGYALALNLISKHPVTKRMGVVFHKDGKYTVYYADKIETEYGFSGFDLFLDCLRIKKLLEGC